MQLEIPPRASLTRAWSFRYGKQPLPVLNAGGGKVWLCVEGFGAEIPYAVVAAPTLEAACDVFVDAWAEDTGADEDAARGLQVVPITHQSQVNARSYVPFDFARPPGWSSKELQAWYRARRA